MTYVEVDVDAVSRAQALESIRELDDIFPRGVEPTPFISDTIYTGALILALVDSVLLAIGVIALVVR
jgi:hypothetical protein